MFLLNFQPFMIIQLLEIIYTEKKDIKNILTFRIRSGYCWVILSHSLGCARQRGDIAKWARKSIEYVTKFDFGGEFAFSSVVTFMILTFDKFGFLKYTLSITTKIFNKLPFLVLENISMTVRPSLLGKSKVVLNPVFSLNIQNTLLN